MFKKFILMFFAFFIFIPYVKSWDEIGSGDGLEQSTSSSCKSSPGCHCKWNNAYYGALQFSIIYYDGNIRHILGKPVAYYNTPSGTSYKWVTDRIKGAIHKKWLPYTSANTSSSDKIEEALIGNNQKNKDYPIIREIFKDIGVDYEALLAAVNSNGSYKDGNITYKNMINEKIKSGKGAATRGIRVVVEPIVTIESTGFCNSYDKIIDRAFTVKNLFAWAYGRTDSGYKILPDHTLTDFATLLWLEEGDAGYQEASKNVILSQVSSSKSGWGLNIYGPYDDIQTDICDPDQDYDGYTSGIQYCCKKYNITATDKSNNKTKEEGGNLKRKLTDSEINTECNKQKCDPNIDGVDKCCTECGITPGNLSNNKESDCLTAPIAPTDLENSSCNKGKGENCEYALDVENPKTCDKTNIGYVKDIASWDCIFSSSNNSKVKNHYFDGDSNDYCAVYCKEEINMSLPKSGVTAKQGRFLVLGDITTNLSSITDKINPVTYKGKKTCKITSTKGSAIGEINKTKFINDMKIIEDKVSTYWDSWKILEAQQKACDTGTAKYNNISYSCALEINGAKPNYSTRILEAKKKYEEAIKTRKSYIDQINACSQYAENRSYNFEPSLQFEYTEPVYGFDSNNNIKKWSLNIIEKTKNQNLEYTNTSNLKSNNIQYVTDVMFKCTGDKTCTKAETYKYPKSIKWESNINIEYKYGLPDNLYRYVSKSTARSFSSKKEAGGDNSVDLGISNLPIHVSTVPGYYDYKITTISLGSRNKFNNYIINNKPFNNKNYSQIKDYSCKFKVDCEDPVIVPDLDDYCEECEDSDLCITKPCDPNDPDCDKGGGSSVPDCDPKTDPNCDKGGSIGVDLIYRPISLYSKKLAFPGIKGDGRNPGKNWGDSQIENFIVNNRGVESYEIYKQSPLYEVILTPSLMKEIRQYNKELNSKQITIYEGAVAKTGVAGYGDYESMKCLGNGTMCVSEKIRDWGVDGCAIDGYDSSKFKVCNSTLDKPWGLN